MSEHAFIVSLDYELFFGHRPGTVDRSMIEPTNALAAAAESGGFRLTLFVDVGYLSAARRESTKHAAVRRQYESVAAQLRQLASRGHDLQLHVHPHWEDSYWDGDSWVLDTSRYRLHDFPAEDVGRILCDYREHLEDIRQDPVFAYRAGGWCIQPFDRLRDALRAAGVWLDSTVYGGGYSEVEARAYDFRDAPDASSIWRFDADPGIPDPRGWFLEVPITACVYGPSVFWRIAMNRLLKPRDARPFGDGSVMAANNRYYLRRLIAPQTRSPVSIDGVKSGYLQSVFDAFVRRQGGDVFNVMGHPKSVTPRGIEALKAFARRNKPRLASATLQDFAGHAPPQ